MIIEQIKEPSDLRKLSKAELSILAREIRDALINKTSVCGGHVASNLGIVEITIALHTVFDSPVDKIIFDVSHQTYVHKILTGRKDAFLQEEKYGEVTGYSNPDESEHDFFHIGHTSTSISLACGMAKARDLAGNTENIIAVIGDASLDGGEAFEALNYASELGSGLIVVINDNDMSIPENYGGLSKQLRILRDCDGNISDNYFRSLGFDYLLVKDGHDIDALLKAFNKIKDTKKPTVVHCCTKKGKGYSFAEANKERWHWARPFNIESGEYYGEVPKENYGAIVAEHLLAKMEKDPGVIVVAASTPLCIGFNEQRRKRAGRQYVDVGIAEQNAITMAAAIAQYGGKPVFATNSTFYQRAYDQIEQEMCIGKCSATMIVTHASVYGHTNDTHVGLYDIALLSGIPNLVYLAPTNIEEYLSMLDWSIEQKNVPVAIRVPWTKVVHSNREVLRDYSKEQYEIVSQGKKIAILALGSFFDLGQAVADDILTSLGIKCTLINPRFITGIDAVTLSNLLPEHELVVTLEDGILIGGFGSKIAQFFGLTNMKVLNKGFYQEVPRSFIPEEWMECNRLQVNQIVDDIKQIVFGD